MSFSKKLTLATHKYAPSLDSKDAISFQSNGGMIVCFINGVGGAGSTAEQAFNLALESWATISGGSFRRRTSKKPRRRASRR